MTTCDCAKCGKCFDGADMVAFAVKKGRSSDWRPKVCPACLLTEIRSWPDADAAAYAAQPPTEEEVATDDDGLGWDAEGWEES